MRQRLAETGPLVTFRLEGTLLPYADKQAATPWDQLSGDIAQGANASLRAVHQASGEAAVVTSFPRDVARALIDLTGLEVDRVYSDVGNHHALRAELSMARPWAHVGNTSRDAHAAHREQVQSVTVVGNDTALIGNTHLQGRGDELITTLDEFPSLYDFESHRSRIMPRAEAIARLEAVPTRWDYWMEHELVPVYRDARGRQGVARSYIEDLERYLNGREIRLNQVRFATLIWRSFCGNFAARQAAKAELAKRRQDGAIRTTREVAQRTWYTPASVERWAGRGFLPAFQATSSWCRRARPYFYQQSEIEPICVVLDSFTEYEAADLLNTDHLTVRNLAKKGVIPATPTPNGFRFAAEALQAHAEATFLERDEVLKVLDISPNTLNLWVNAGILNPEKRGHATPSFSADQVERLQAERERLSVDFAWLQPHVRSNWHRHPEVMRQLKCSETLLRHLTQYDLLPHANTVPAGLDAVQPRYQYAGHYLDDLIDYAAGRRITIALARQFKQQCCKAQSLPSMEQDVAA